MNVIVYIKQDIKDVHAHDVLQYVLLFSFYTRMEIKPRPTFTLRLGEYYCSLLGNESTLSHSPRNKMWSC